MSRPVISRQAAARALIRAGLARDYRTAAAMLPPDPSAACNMIGAELVSALISGGADA